MLSLYPIDSLTDIDKETILEYLKLNKIVVENLDNVLDTWNKNKIRLFKLFGQKLRISFPVKAKSRNYYLKQQIKDFYTYPHNLFQVIEGSNYDLSFYGKSDWIIKEYNIQNPFIKDTLLFFSNKENGIDAINYKYFLALLDYDDIFCNIYRNWALYYMKDKKSISIKYGTKTMRAIRKVLEFFNYPNMKLFEEWRDKISAIRTTTHIDSQLTFSIHPIDYMTLSDNESNWTSCLNWRNNGCYSNGTLELLNSNMAIVCYLENPNTKFVIGDNFTIPNKMWRAIGYVHKKILLIGANYPFSDRELSKQSLSLLEEIAQKSFKWTYKYKCQEYRDMVYFDEGDFNNGSMEEIKFNLDYPYTNVRGKHIFLGSNNLYNDLAMSPTSTFYCSRNPVKSDLFLNVSGKCLCLTCGDYIENGGSSKICYKCEREYKCDNCKEININAKHYTINFTCPDSHLYDLSKNFDSVDKLRSYEFTKRTFCEKCIAKAIEEEKIIIFQDGKNLFFVDNKLEEYFGSYYRSIIGDIKFSSFEVWYYRCVVLKDDSTFDTEDKELARKMRTFFDERYRSMTWEDLEKIL